MAFILRTLLSPNSFSLITVLLTKLVKWPTSVGISMALEAIREHMRSHDLVIWQCVCVFVCVCVCSCMCVCVCVCMCVCVCVCMCMCVYVCVHVCVCMCVCSCMCVCVCKRVLISRADNVWAYIYTYRGLWIIDKWVTEVNSYLADAVSWRSCPVHQGWTVTCWLARCDECYALHWENLTPVY